MVDALLKYVPSPYEANRPAVQQAPTGEDALLEYAKDSSGVDSVLKYAAEEPVLIREPAQNYQPKEEGANALLGYVEYDATKDNPYVGAPLESLKDIQANNQEVLEYKQSQVPKLSDPRGLAEGFLSGYADLPLLPADIARGMSYTPAGWALNAISDKTGLPSLNDMAGKYENQYAGMFGATGKELREATERGMARNPVGFIAGGVGLGEGIAAKAVKELTEVYPALRKLGLSSFLPKAKAVDVQEATGATNDEAINALFDYAGAPQSLEEQRLKQLTGSTDATGLIKSTAADETLYGKYPGMVDDLLRYKEVPESADTAISKSTIVPGQEYNVRHRKDVDAVAEEMLRDEGVDFLRDYETNGPSGELKSAVRKTLIREQAVEDASNLFIGEVRDKREAARLMGRTFENMSPEMAQLVTQRMIDKSLSPKLRDVFDRVPKIKRELDEAANITVDEIFKPRGEAPTGTSATEGQILDGLFSKDKNKLYPELNIDVEREISWNNKVNQLNEEIAKLRSSTPIDDSLEAKLAGKVKSHVKTPKALTGEELYKKNLLDSLFSIAKGVLPTKTKKTPQSIFDVVGQAIDSINSPQGYPQFSQEAYREVYEKAQRLIDKDTMPDAVKASLKGFVDDLFTKPYSDSQVQKSLNEVIKLTDTNVEDLAKMHWAQRDKIGNSLTDFLHSQLGVDKNLAAGFEQDFRSALSAKVKLKQGKVLERAFKAISPRKVKPVQDKILELYNAGALDDQTFRQAFADKFKVPVLTPEIQQALTRQAEAVQVLDKGTDARKFEEAKLLNIMSEAIPATLGQKLKAFQDIVFLGNPATQVTNVVGNVIKPVLDSSATMAAYPIDLVDGLLTGRRDIALPSLMDYLKGAKKGLKEGWKETVAGVNTTNLDKAEITKRGRIFDNPLLHYPSRVTYGGLQLMDRTAYEAMKSKVVDELTRASEKAAPRYKRTAREIEEIAEREALEATYQNDTSLTDFTHKLRKGADDITNAITLNKLGEGYGAGTFNLPYSRTPTNLFTSPVTEYSPLGFINAALQPDSRAVKNMVGRAIVGSGLWGAGAGLSGAGIYNAYSRVNGSYEGNKRLRDVNYERGVQPSSLNVGGVNVGINRLAPLSTALNTGSALRELAGQGDNLVSAYPKAVLMGLEGTLDLPALTSMKGVSDTLRSEKGLERAGDKFITDFISRLNLSESRHIARSLDPTIRDPYDPNPVVEGVNRATAGTPGLSKELPAKKGTLGATAERFTTGNAIGDLVVNTLPVTLSRIKEDSDIEKLVEVYIKTGKTSALPREVEDSRTVDGKKEKISVEGHTKLVDLLGSEQRRMLNEAMSSPEFQGMSFARQAEVLDSLFSQAVKNANSQTFGEKPVDFDSLVNSRINGRFGRMGALKNADRLGDLAPYLLRESMKR